MSLHDIFMQRAALEHQNALVSDNTGMVLQSLAEGVAKGISEEQQRVQKQKDEERDYQRSVSLLNEKAKLEEKLLRSKNEIENEGLIRSRQLMIEKEELENKSTKIRSELEKQKLIALNDADLQKRKELIAEQGRVDAGLIKLRSELNDAQATMKPDELYRQESLAIRRENLEQKIKEERRRVLTQKLSNAKSFGGVFSEDDMNALTQDVGFDIGTDVNTGRIEKTEDGKYRILSNDEFTKKSAIMKDVADAESGLNVVANDVEQVSRLFDAVPKELRGTVGGRVNAPVAGFLGNAGVRIYDDMKKAFIGNIARSVLLERGVLTDKDVERAAGLLPKLEDTDEIKVSKINEIKNLLNTRYNEFRRRKEVGVGAVKSATSQNKDFSGLW